MAFSDDSVLARLTSLNESHDSIATAAQWIMFHRRHADRTAHIWLQRLRESSSTKRLSLVYLANEVTQQSKARNRPDFVVAFSPIIAEALGVAYKGAPSEIQGKLRRVVEVWADRNIFEPPIQAAIESRLQDADKVKNTSKAGGFTVPAAAVPAGLTSLVNLHQNIDKTLLHTKGAVTTADQEWSKLQDPAAPVPSAPVYAARLNGLLRSLAEAEGAVSNSVKARLELVRELEKILGDASAALADDEAKLAVLSKRKADTEDKRREVEFAIMRTLPSQQEPSSTESRDGPSQSPVPEPERPEVEELTPPPEARPSSADAQAPTGMEMLSNLASQYQSLPVSTNGSNKRRRIDDEDFPDLGVDDGIDADTAAMLRPEGNET